MNCLMKAYGFVALGCLLFASMADRADAQSYGETLAKGIRNQNSSGRYSIQNIQNRLANRSVSGAGVQGLNRQQFTNPFSNSTPQRNKPFASLQRGPAVSPYLKLNGSLDSVADYYSYVRPERENQRQNLAQQRQMNANRQRLNAMAAQGAYNIQGDPNMATTGHTSTYMYMGNFGTTGNFFPAPIGMEKQRIDQ